MTGFTLDRRSFLRTGATFCGACACTGFSAFAMGDDDAVNPQLIDPEKLSYCGYTCPEDCKLLKATVANDEQLKREAFDAWKIQERFGIEFDPKTAICYGCKSLDKPEGVVIGRCDVRACAEEKQHASCIQCGELTGCDKDLWRRFPEFKQQVVGMRERFLAQA